MTQTGWIVVGIVLLVLLVLFLTNDHLRCVLTFGEWRMAFDWREGYECAY